MDLTDQERELLFLGVAAEFVLPLRVVTEKEMRDFVKNVYGCVDLTVKGANVSKKDILDSVIDINPRSFRYLSFGAESGDASMSTVKLTRKMNFELAEKDSVLEMIDQMIENTHEENIKRGVIPSELIIRYLTLIYTCITAVDEELAVVFSLAVQRMNEVNANFFMFDQNIFQYPIFLRALASEMLIVLPDTAKIIYDAIGFARDQTDLFMDMEISAFRESSTNVKKALAARFFEDNADLLKDAPKDVKQMYAETLAQEDGDLGGILKMVEYNILDCKTFRFKNGKTIPEVAIARGRRDLVDLCKTKMVRQFGFKK